MSHPHAHHPPYAPSQSTFFAHPVGGPVIPLAPGTGSVAPHDTQHQPMQAPLVATGDWTKDLVHLAKTAELKKHALTLQLHTAHILSAHASLEQKGKMVQDVREQKNKLESERNRLLNCLREINEDRDKADLLEVSIERECAELRGKITSLSEGEYAIAKQDVDRLRQELGQGPLPSLQATLEEKSAQYLNERRLNGDGHAQVQLQPAGTTPMMQKRSGTEVPVEMSGSATKRPRGRPRGSKNKMKGSANNSGSQ